jgi:nucleoside 2-deoxyribosyltransferase
VFQEQPQAFLALPDAVAHSKVADALRQTLLDHSVEIASTSTSSPQAGATLSDQAHAGLRRADFIIADLTGRNAHVVFEVGMAIGLGKPVLLFSQGSTSDLPFDLRARQVIVYRPEDVETVRRYVSLWLRDLLAARRRAVSPS